MFSRISVRVSFRAKFSTILSEKREQIQISSCQRMWRRKETGIDLFADPQKRKEVIIPEGDKFTLFSLQIEIACCSPELPTEVLEILNSWFRKCRPRLIQFPNTFAVDWVDKATCPAGCSWNFTWSSKYPGSDSLNNWLTLVNAGKMDYLLKWHCPGCHLIFTIVFLR